MARVYIFLSKWINLFRIRQWYKNLLIFLPLFFIAGIFDSQNFFLTLLGFLCLCLVSSATYIINDLVDIKKDRLNPEKSLRPLAAGTIKTSSAIFVMLILLSGSLVLSYSLDFFFFLALCGIFLFGQLYTFWLKRIIFADILTIATLFVIRAISGVFIIKVSISPWLILCPFFLSLFLSVGKRHSEQLLMGEKAMETRGVLKDYDPTLTNALMIISTTLLVASYALYSILSEHDYLILTLPFALFVIFRFFWLIQQGSLIARHPERIVSDLGMVAGVLLWVIVTFLTIYLPIA